MLQFPGFTRLRRNLSNEVFAGLVVELLDDRSRRSMPRRPRSQPSSASLPRNEGLGAALKWRKAQFET